MLSALPCLRPCRVSGSLLPARAPAHCHSRKERHDTGNALGVPSAVIACPAIEARQSSRGTIQGTTAAALTCLRTVTST